MRFVWERRVRGRARGVKWLPMRQGPTMGPTPFFKEYNTYFRSIIELKSWTPQVVCTVYVAHIRHSRLSFRDFSRDVPQCLRGLSRSLFFIDQLKVVTYYRLLKPPPTYRILQCILLHFLFLTNSDPTQKNTLNTCFAHPLFKCKLSVGVACKLTPVLRRQYTIWTVKIRLKYSMSCDELNWLYSEP